MSAAQPITAAQLDVALGELEQLAAAEYGETLADLLTGDEPVRGDEPATMNVRDSHDAFWRLGRLVGITVKEPFASARPATAADLSQTGARRVWDLDRSDVAAAQPELWQYRLLAEFLATEKRAGYFDWLPPTDEPEALQIVHFLGAAHSERGVFGALMKSARKYLCANADVQAAFREPEQPTDGDDSPDPSSDRPVAGSKGKVRGEPVQIVAAGMTSSSAGILIDAVPWLGPSMAPFVAGLLLLITVKGLDDFCSRTVPSPVTGVVET